jgi:type VI protein secretion system component Hcp
MRRLCAVTLSLFAVPLFAAVASRNVAQPDTQLAFDTSPAEEISLVSVRPQTPNTVVVVARNARPSFFRNCVAGAHYKTVTLAMRKAGGTQQEYLKFTLKDVIVTGVSRNADGSASIAMRYGFADGSVRSYQDVVRH